MRLLALAIKDLFSILNLYLHHPLKQTKVVINLGEIYSEESYRQLVES